MPKDYSSQDLVVLPRLSAQEADVLSTQLLTAATDVEKEEGGQPLPTELSRPRTRLQTADEALQAVLGPKEEESQEKKEADQFVDTSWKAMHRWLDGWRTLPGADNVNRAKAEKLFKLCFDEGLAFTNFRYLIEWQESGTRLTAINKEDIRKTFTDLGGLVFLTTLETAHARYGNVLGITSPLPETDLAIRPQLDALIKALRDYVGKVGTYPDPDVPGSKELSARLLRPLVEWDLAKAAKTSASGTAVAPPSPPTPPTPEEPPTLP